MSGLGRAWYCDHCSSYQVSYPRPNNTVMTSVKVKSLVYVLDL
jgi:hypothetical protein